MGKTEIGGNRKAQVNKGKAVKQVEISVSSLDNTFL